MLHGENENSISSMPYYIYMYMYIGRHWEVFNRVAELFVVESFVYELR
jgi:hypothetical protein